MSSDVSSDSIKRLNEMIGDIEVAMVTTIADDGTLQSRPMATQPVLEDGTVCFFASTASQRSFLSEENAYANISYVDAKRSVYISISGTASLMDDRETLKKLWDPGAAAWFPKGLDDPDLRLLCLQIERAEYWDVASNALTLLFGYARKAITGKSEGIGTHERIV